MGVDVKAWGRTAWDVLYWLAAFLDSRGMPYDSYFLPLQYVLPCVFCRQSVVPFYAEARRLHLGSAQGMVRYLHALVKQKLENQRMGRPVTTDRPSDMNLAEANYPSSDEPDMKKLELLMMFIMCDTGNGHETLKWVGHVLDLIPPLGDRWREHIAAMGPETLLGRLKAVCGTFGWARKACETFSVPQRIVGYHPSMLTLVDKKWLL